MIACGAGAGVMNRTKWMRLAVRDLGDVIRWAGAQNAREIGEFRYRVVNGREIVARSEEHTSELQSLAYLVCRLLLENKKYMVRTRCEAARTKARKKRQ